MIENVYHLAQTDERSITKVLLDNNLHYLHLVLPAGDRLPVHNSNAPIYLTILRGELQIRLNEQVTESHPAHTLITIPSDTSLDLANESASAVEFIIIKAPAPAV